MSLIAAAGDRRYRIQTTADKTIWLVSPKRLFLDYTTIVQKNRIITRRTFDKLSFIACYLAHKLLAYFMNQEKISDWCNDRQRTEYG